MIKKWKYLFATQFLGVFNDNLLKWLICFISINWVIQNPNREDALISDPSMIISIASALLVIPFIFFSALAGKIAVMKSKVKIVQRAKLLEMPIMLLAVLGFYLNSLNLVFAALFFMGLQSALFSPSKYGLIRDVGGVEGLSYGAGSMEMLGFIGVLLGTVIAGLISDVKDFQILIMGSALFITALFGWLTSKGIKVEEPKLDENFHGNVNPIKFLWQNFKWSKNIKGLNTTILGLGTFWLVGALVQMNLIVYCPENLGLTNTQTSIVVSFVAIGIGIGCYVSGLLAKNKVELGLVPIGGLGLSICMTSISFIDLSVQWFIVNLFFASFFSGLYKVPLSAWLQERVLGRKVGDILAYNNLVVFIFILLSAVIFGIVESSFGSVAVFKTIAGISWIITMVTMTKIPAMMVRFFVYVLGHTFFKIKINGGEHIPIQSGALVVANHLSLLDALLVVAAVPRMIRFVAHKKVYDHPLLNWWMKKLNVIPIQPKGGKDALEEFNKTCQDEINAGHVVCIFSEGQMSRTGHLNEFKKGVEFIASGIDAPIIPLHFDNVIGSPFSYYTGSSALFKFRRSTLKRNVTIGIGEPMSNASSAFQVRQKVVELSAKNFGDRILDHYSLSYFFVKNAKEYPKKIFTQNASGKYIQYKEALSEVLGISNALKIKLDKHQIIGIHVKDRYKRVLFNLSLNLLGKTVVNIDEASEVTNSHLEPKLDLILCDKEFSFLYTLNASCIISQELTYTSGRIPIKTIKGILKDYNPDIHCDQISSIIFNRQQDGQINEIKLSNKNILCNILGLKQVHHINEDDSILAQLPFSSSFGYTINLWMPCSLGLKAFYYPLGDNENVSPSIIVGWEEEIDRVIQSHMSSYPLNKIKHVITGQLLLSPEKEDWIEKNWLTQVRYGFGLPECSPIISVNSEDFKISDLMGKINYEQGNLKGSVGRPLPGVAVKIIDIKNENELGVNEMGLIMVKGPSIISKEQSLIPKSFWDGWMLTEFEGQLDDRGFLSLKSAQDSLV